MKLTHNSSDFFDNQPTLEISWNAIEHNINYFRSKLEKDSKLMVMVKANAYGYDGWQVSKRIDEKQLADYFGVATIKEGVELRKMGIKLPILVQNPSFDEWEKLLKNELEPTLQNFEGLLSYSKYLESIGEVGTDYFVHLEFNTGMNRFGFNLSDIEELKSFLNLKPPFRIRSIMSHLSSSGNFDEEEFTLAQLNAFTEIKEAVKDSVHPDTLFHILNTDGMNSYTNYQLNMVRIGIGIYGASGSKTLQSNLIPSATFKAKVVGVRRVNKGESIGYNRSGLAVSNINVAILSLGYADGFLRMLGNGNWEVEINGKLYPTIGDICMDLCMLNLGDDTVNLSDEAIIFGSKKTIFDYANALQTITYEAVTLIGNRVRRTIVD